MSAAARAVVCALLAGGPGALAAAPVATPGWLAAEVSSDGRVLAKSRSLLRRESDAAPERPHRRASRRPWAARRPAVLLRYGDELGDDVEEDPEDSQDYKPSNQTVYEDNDGIPMDCDMTKQMCCNANKSESKFMQCLDQNCRYIEKTPKICGDFGLCTTSCSMNCCCAGQVTYQFLVRVSKGFRDGLVQMLVMVMAMSQGAASNREGLPQPKNKEAPDPGEAIKYTTDVVMDICKLWTAVPVGFLLLSLFHERVKKAVLLFWKVKVKKEGNVRTDEMTPAQRAQFEADQDAKEKVELSTLVSDAEADRLGGIEDHVLTKVSGLSMMWWALTNSYGLAFFYFLMSTPVRTSACVLGQSGRVMVLDRTPLMSSTKAAKAFIGIGVSIMGFATMLHCSFRSSERSVLQAKESDDEAVRAAIANDAFSQILVGKVHFFTAAFIVVAWCCAWAMLKTRIRPWGYNDERNFYESGEASVAQYFRSGIRGAIPFLSKRRRVGGMRLFFGPYPEKAIFNHLGSQFDTFKCVEPMLVLPSETAGAYPPSGNPTKTRSPEEQAQLAQLVLGLLNAFLGTLGIVLFGISMYNLATCVQSCPVGSAIRPCVQGTDCTAVARAPWFQRHLLANNLRSHDQIVRDSMMAQVSVDTVALWLDTASTEATTKMILNISQTACAKRHDELFSDANVTVNSPNANPVAVMDAKNYLAAYKKYKMDVKWDPALESCQDCTNAFVLQYFTGFNNIIELFEIFLLFLTVYASVIVFNMLNHKLSNCPMIDVPFQSDPGSANDIDVDKIEQACLNMIGHAFSARYKHAGVPEHVKKLEEDARKKAMAEDTSKLPDPWRFDTESKKWEEYALSPKTNARMMIVSKDLLGILANGDSPEEVLSAWSEAPRLTTKQKFIIFGGMLFFGFFPTAWAAYQKKIQCFAESVVVTCIHYWFCDYFILRRRPQAGFILTSRRLFQVTKRPAYRDIFGRVEPLIKMDVLVHDSGLTYSSLTMEAYVPAWRRWMARLMRVGFYRQGQVIVQGSRGIFKFWRVIGDTREAFDHMSQIHFMQKIVGLNSHEGEEKMREEKEEGQDELPDPTCSCCCCPYTPPPLAMKGGNNLLDRYATRFKGEKDVYTRKLAIRPSTCGELCCGRGCNFECSCCCCCQLDELLTELTMTTHRVIVEQRAVQRYCRFFACCRTTPNLRVTMLAHIKASAYLRDAPAQAWGLQKLRMDLQIKLLIKGAREYPAGLMLNQRPYLILSKKNLPIVDKLWVENICYFYDLITQRVDFESDGSEESEEDSADESYEEEEHDPNAFDKGSDDSSTGKGKGKKGKSKKGKRKKGEDNPEAFPAELMEDSDESGEERGKGKGKSKKGKKGKSKKGAQDAEESGDEQGASDEPSSVAKGKGKDKSKKGKSKKGAQDAEESGDEQGASDEPSSAAKGKGKDKSKKGKSKKGAKERARLLGDDSEGVSE